MEPKAKVIFPLYIYPLTEKTWQPLYEAYVLVLIGLLRFLEAF